MRDANNRTDDEENVSHYAERHRRDYAPDQYQHLQRGRFRFPRSQGKSAFKKRLPQRLSVPASCRANQNAPPDCGIHDSRFIVERFPT